MSCIQTMMDSQSCYLTDRNCCNNKCHPMGWHFAYAIFNRYIGNFPLLCYNRFQAILTETDI